MAAIRGRAKITYAVQGVFSRRPRLFAFSTIAVAVLGAQSTEEVLKRVDQYRYPWPNFSMEMTLRGDKVDQQWKVLVRENGDSRVEGISAKEKGRTVLLLKDQMWLLLPTAKHPVKVSPQQRLLGPASGGDVARFRFYGDYAISEEREDTLEGLPCKRLELKAKRQDLSYRTAVLWLSTEGAPLKAEYIYASGKAARTVQFGPLASAHGNQVLSSLELVEPSGMKVELHFSNWKPAQVPDQLFQLPGEAK